MSDVRGLTQPRAADGGGLCDAGFEVAARNPDARGPMLTTSEGEIEFWFFNIPRGKRSIKSDGTFWRLRQGENVLIRPWLPERLLAAGH